MSTKQLLLDELETLPPQGIEEVYNFVTSLKTNKTDKGDTSNIHLASESVLAVDWLLPEEGEAWASL